MQEENDEIKTEDNTNQQPKLQAIERKCPKNIPGNENIHCFFDCEIKTC